MGLTLIRIVQLLGSCTSLGRPQLIGVHEGINYFIVDNEGKYEVHWHTPTLLEDSNVNPKTKTTEEGVVVHSSACSTSRVEGHAKIPGWGFRWMISESIIHTDRHKPNNKLVNA